MPGESLTEQNFFHNRISPLLIPFDGRRSKSNAESFRFYCLFDASATPTKNVRVLKIYIRRICSFIIYYILDIIHI